jgi:hypothetical protein
MDTGEFYTGPRFRHADDSRTKRPQPGAGGTIGEQAWPLQAHNLKARFLLCIFDADQQR